MRILVRGANFINKGAEAMLLTVRNELEKRIPGSSFCIERERVPGFTAERAELEQLQIVEDPMKLFGRSLSTYSFALRRPRQAAAAGVFSSRCGPEAHAASQVDAVIDVAGYAYGDIWPLAKIKRTTRFLTACQVLSRPYIFLPQAWGPFEESDRADQYRQLFQRATRFFARDVCSRDHIAKVLGVSADTIPLESDIAFRFQGAPADIGQAAIESLGLTLGKSPLAVIAPNMKVYERTAGKGSENTYVQSLIHIGKNLLSRGMQVLLLPHDIQPFEDRVDDRWLCKLVAQHLQDPRCAAVTAWSPAADLKSMVKHADLLIGSRFHALIAAISSRKPVLALGWSHKYPELLRGFGQEDFVVGLEGADRKDLESRIDRMINDRTNIVTRIDQAAVQVEAAIDALFNQVAAAIDPHKMAQAG